MIRKLEHTTQIIKEFGIFEIRIINDYERYLQVQLHSLFVQFAFDCIAMFVVILKSIK